MKKILTICCFSYLSLFAVCPDLSRGDLPQNELEIKNVLSQNQMNQKIYFDAVKNYNHSDSIDGKISKYAYESFINSPVYQRLSQLIFSHKKIMKGEEDSDYKNIILSINPNNSNWCN